MKNTFLFSVCTIVSLTSAVSAQEMPEYPEFLDPRELLLPSGNWSIERAMREARSVYLSGEYYFYTVGGLICLTEESVEIDGRVISLPAKTLHCGCVWSSETKKMLSFSSAFNSELARLIAESDQ